MKKLDLKKIKQVDFDEDQYVRTATTKTQIVLHHTAGNSSGVNTIRHWNTDSRGRIATCVVISGPGSKNSEDGEICQAFSSKYWAYHLGLKPDVFAAKNVIYQRLDKTSIGIEICNWGPLKKINGKFYNYVNREVPETEVCELETEYKGYKYYHKYSEAQIESIRQLLVYWNEVYNIPLDYHESEMWELSKKALSGDPGIYTHNSYRYDKSDISPQPAMIEMLKNLNNKNMAKQKPKDIKIDAEIDGNKISIEKDEEGLDIVYDGKNRDIEYHKTDDEKSFKYDGKKLDIDVKKTNEKTEIDVQAETGLLRWVGKIISKFVLKRFKR